jgi:hypothetical protein
VVPLLEVTSGPFENVDWPNMVVFEDVTEERDMVRDALGDAFCTCSKPGGRRASQGLVTVLETLKMF